MSQLRLNTATGDWVLVASERGKRPNSYQDLIQSHDEPEYDPGCPFCPGNRDEKDHFTLPQGKDWSVKVLPNKFPAVSPGEYPLPSKSLFERHMTASGVHDVVVESPRHNYHFATGTQEELHLVLQAWRKRYRQLAEDEHTRHIVVFKNYGAKAGSSLPHTHSQVVSLPVLPSQVRQRIETAMHVSNTLGRCVFCCMLEHEQEASTRIVDSTPGFSAFVPYAAFSPFSIWLLPHRHSCDFSTVTDQELRELSAMLHRLAIRLATGLGDPDYNLVLRSAVPSTVGKDFFHWYISLVPRLQKSAGFELGTGMFINTSLPEDDAEFLRGVNIETL